MLIVTLLALTAGSVMAGLAHSISLMIIARVVQGLGGGVLPISFGIIRDEFPAERVRGAVGITAALTAFGGGIGLLMAGPIVDNLDYHWLFWIPAIMTGVATVATFLFVPESPCAPPAGSAGARRCCSRPGWWRCCWPSARARPGAGAPAGSWGCSPPPWSAPPCGSWSNCAPPTR
ncbi:MFS transporter [Streptacidiphilus sp. 4-A2]|nr:MFS transporter [Streptacidiphilus sp. 4-A2]